MQPEKNQNNQISGNYKVQCVWIYCVAFVLYLVDVGDYKVDILDIGVVYSSFSCEHTIARRFLACANRRFVEVYIKFLFSYTGSTTNR